MNATIRESGEIRFVCDAHYLQTKCAYAIVDILRAEFADARTFAKSWPNRTCERSRCVIHTSLHIARRSMSACPASLHAAVPRAPRRAPRARALRCRAGPAGGGADGRASVWSLEQRKALEAKKDDELSKAPEPARPPPPASLDAVDAKMSRRQVGLSASVGLSALLGADVVFPSDAEAKKIISGYVPADGSFTVRASIDRSLDANETRRDCFPYDPVRVVNAIP